MKVSVILFFAALSCLAASPAWARIGETLEECIARYGNVTKIDEQKGQIFFEKNGYAICATFFNGQVDTMSFKRRIPGSDTFAPLNAEEIQLLLKANGGDKKWQSRNVDGPNPEWQTEDGLMFADYLSGRIRWRFSARHTPSG